MEQFITPDIATGWVASLIVVAGGVSYLFKNIRSRDLQELRDFNKDLLQKTEFLKKEQEDQQTLLKEQQKKIEGLTAEVIALKKHNKTLEDLVVTALTRYFNENPQMAKDMKSIVKAK